MVLLGMRYSKGPNGTKGFTIGRGKPLPGSLPPLSTRSLQAKKDEEKSPISKDSAQLSRGGRALSTDSTPPTPPGPSSGADPSAHGAKSWACVAGAKMLSMPLADSSSAPDHFSDPEPAGSIRATSFNLTPSRSGLGPPPGVPPGLGSLSASPPASLPLSCASPQTEMPPGLPPPAARPSPPPSATAETLLGMNMVALTSHRPGCSAPASSPPSGVPPSPSSSLKAMLGISGSFSVPGASGAPVASSAPISPGDPLTSAPQASYGVSAAVTLQQADGPRLGSLLGVDAPRDTRGTDLDGLGGKGRGSRFAGFFADDPAPPVHAATLVGVPSASASQAAHNELPAMRPLSAGCAVSSGFGGPSVFGALGPSATVGQMQLHESPSPSSLPSFLPADATAYGASRFVAWSTPQPAALQEASASPNAASSAPAPSAASSAPAPPSACFAAPNRLPGLCGHTGEVAKQEPSHAEAVRTALEVDAHRAAYQAARHPTAYAKQPPRQKPQQQLLHDPHRQLQQHEQLLQLQQQVSSPQASQADSSQQRARQHHVQSQVAQLQQQSQAILQQLLVQRHSLTSEQQLEFDQKLTQWQHQQRAMQAHYQAQLEAHYEVQATTHAAAAQQAAATQAATHAMSAQQAAAAQAAVMKTAPKAQQQQQQQQLQAIHVQQQVSPQGTIGASSGFSPTAGQPTALPGFVALAQQPVSGESQQLAQQTQHLKSLLGL